MGVIDARRLIAKYESGDPMTPEEKELLIASLYFCYQQLEGLDEFILRAAHSPDWCEPQDETQPDPFNDDSPPGEKWEAD